MDLHMKQKLDTVTVFISQTINVATGGHVLK